MYASVRRFFARLASEIFLSSLQSGFFSLAGEISESVKESISDRNQRTFHCRDAEFAEFGKVNDNFFLGVRRASAMVFFLMSDSRALRAFMVK